MARIFIMDDGTFIDALQKTFGVSGNLNCVLTTNLLLVKPYDNSEVILIDKNIWTSLSNKISDVLFNCRTFINYPQESILWEVSTMGASNWYHQNKKFYDLFINNTTFLQHIAFNTYNTIVSDKILTTKAVTVDDCKKFISGTLKPLL